MQLSVIVPCLNVAATLADQLEALARQQLDAPWELIICDNGSTDGTLDIARKYADRFTNFHIIDASDRKGQPHAMNLGVLHARSDSLAFCDGDDAVGDGWLKAMAEALQRHEFVVGAFEFNKLNPSWRKAGHPQERGLNRFRLPPYMPHGGSGNMGVKKSVFLLAGGFDEAMPYLFDTDFCFKVQLAGVELHFVADAVMHIRVSATFKEIFRKARANGEYQVMLYKRYRSFGAQRLTWKAAVHGWWQLLKGLSRMRDKGDIASWMWDASWRLGRVKGSIKHRVLAL